ncbi:hypothetical protein BDD12DRAFT_907090 [Trichophaea hybrida]|nr:hypothetical protein BDD12DRAFT_907090 [Trichophaea hybrida]
MVDDIENQTASLAPAIEQPLLGVLEAAGVEQPTITEIVHSSADQVMVIDSNVTLIHTANLIENHSVETTVATQNPEASSVEKAPEAVMDNNENDKDSGDGDVEISDHHEYSDDESEYQPEPDSPPPQSKVKQPKSPSNVNKTPKTPQNTRPPKTPTSRVRSGRVEKSGSPATQSNLRCPVKGCGQTFTGRNPRQSLWHHLKYYATRGLPDRQEFEKLHGEAHSEMKREAEPKGTPVERNRISSSDYRKKNPEKAKTSARLSNFRARARKKGLTTDQEVEEAVLKWEKEWQEKQAKEASEYFSGILLSAFE